MIQTLSWSMRRDLSAGVLAPALLLVAQACGSPRPQASRPEPGPPRSIGASPAAAPERRDPDRPRAGAAGSPPAGEAAGPLLRCPARTSASTELGWVMDREGRICCAPRVPAPGWKPASLKSCLEALAPGLAAPQYVTRSAQPLLQEVVRFERGSARITSAEPLDSAARILAADPEGRVSVLGTTRCGEAPSDAAAARLAADRVSAVQRELERRGVPASRLLAQDRDVFLRSRKDLDHEQALALIDSSAVILHASPPQRRYDMLEQDRCLPGAEATLAIPPAELRGDTLFIEACHAARCATARISLESAGRGDRVALALDGPLSAGALLAWETRDRAVLEVRTVVEDGAALADGDRFSLRVWTDGGIVAQLEESLRYVRKPQYVGSREACPQARARGGAPTR
ncbi:uncharacterized protein SOCE26_040900 [Sorangium cellulosum]|uniref:OmpA-like domain-containing protein n=1 Tax=Sorangium cellulosum TaxID=56 RepID=A0A2L0ETM7_SORCE|nr:uncharacterized protein SOCE26_040900 [Sorangium cellulosum]